MLLDLPQACDVTRVVFVESPLVLIGHFIRVVPVGEPSRLGPVVLDVVHGRGGNCNVSVGCSITTPE